MFQEEENPIAAPTTSPRLLTQHSDQSGVRKVHNIEFNNGQRVRVIMGHALEAAARSGTMISNGIVAEDASSPARQFNELTPPTCLHDILTRQALLTPHNTAIECEERLYTYKELDELTDNLAAVLTEQGVSRGIYVGLSMARSEWPIISILAILKAGGAYIPLEASLPDDRLRYIAEEAGCALILTDEDMLERIERLCNCHILTINDCRKAALSTGTFTPFSAAKPESVCYTLFTSGTTGRPKGVVTEHRNCVHFVNAFNQVCSTTAKDRVFQGFSLGFDGSVEEMWMALSNGATLVCGMPDTPRFGADLGSFLHEKQISFFSTVPTLLATLPEDLPHLRQLVVSGEACPPEIVNRWANGSRDLLNVYGPTEATVNTTCAKLVQGKPVTIGKPLPGYELFILDEQQQLVSEGEEGELFIGGPGISRGYLNQKELSDKAYINWPEQSYAEGVIESNIHQKRLYRTGDLVRRNEEGELEFFGRIDTQVKLRGFRVELSEIEAVLIDQPGITAAAVKVLPLNEMDTLVAYIIPDEGVSDIDRGALLHELKDKLPSYMVPQYLEILSEFPRVPSGKVDRNRLPHPESPLSADAGMDEEYSELEADIAGIWAEHFGLMQVGLNQDFFTDLGGHSLVAAKVTGLLYHRLNLNVSIRDLYGSPTVRQLAALVADRPKLDAAVKHSKITWKVTLPASRKWGVVTPLVQSLYFLAIIPLLALPFVYTIPLAVETIRTQASPVALAITALAVAGATWLAVLTLAILSKWLLIGRYKPGRYPLWGSFYIRWWLASRLQHLSFMQVFNGTPLGPWIWRLMGAKVGKASALNPSLVYAWDCIEIGDDVSVGKDTQMPALRVEDGDLIIGTIKIGDRCYIGNHSVLGQNVEMQDGACLDDQSRLADGETAAAETQYRGSPAAPAAFALPSGTPLRPGFFKLTAFTVVQLTLGLAVALLMLAPVAGSLWLTLTAAYNWPVATSAPLIIALVPATYLAFAFWAALCKKLVYPNPEAGEFALYSGTYLRHWLSDIVMQIARTIGLSIFTTLYLPAWMRLLGAKLGKHTEMSTVWRINPDMVTAGDGVFFADGCMLGGSRQHLGRMRVEPVTVGDRSFIGNSAILSCGNQIGSDCLLGVLSAVPDQQSPVEDNRDYLGSPGFRLPNRDRNTSFDEKLTFKPGVWLYTQRAIIDTLRILTPGYLVTGLAITSLFAVMWAYEGWGTWGAYTVIPLMTWVALSACLITVVGLKKLIMGRYKPETVPLWCRYVWWNEYINGLYESLIAPWISNFFGTPFAAMLLRMMGCKIGKRCFIETDLFSEFDLVDIGDDCALNAGAVIQNHLFEDRVMKSSHVEIQDHCTVGNMSIVIYDSVMEQGAKLAPMSLLLKGQTLPTGKEWHGIPVERI